MINLEDVIYQAKVNGYYHYYDINGFITAFNDSLTANKNAQCLYRIRINCQSKKEFEIEASYACQRLFELL